MKRRKTSRRRVSHVRVPQNWKFSRIQMTHKTLHNQFSEFQMLAIKIIRSIFNLIFWHITDWWVHASRSRSEPNRMEFRVQQTIDNIYTEKMKQLFACALMILTVCGNINGMFEVRTWSNKFWSQIRIGQFYLTISASNYENRLERHGNMGANTPANEMRKCLKVNHARTVGRHTDHFVKR